MIILYSGTPGSGKSLHMAQVMYWRLKAGKPIVSNFEINLDNIRGKLGDFVVLDNATLTPASLVRYSSEYAVRMGRRLREGEITLVIDECQLLFNSRDWGQKNRGAWLSFFSQHRHLGYDIVLIAQFDRMIDRQIRSLIEYEYIHRKVNNYGLAGRLLGLVAFNRPIFTCIKMWYPMKQRVGSEFFTARKRYYRLYDTYAMFAAPE